MVGSLVTLDGSASTSADHTPLTYQWTLIEKPTGSTATLSSTTTVKPTFTADMPGTYIASLIINDVQLTPAFVTITAARTNAAPIANAGNNQNVMVNTVVILSGIYSSDVNGHPLTYRWTLTSKPTGSSATLSSITSALPTFIADIAGTYTALLVVNDGQLDSNTASVSVTATRTNAAPVANAGSPQNVMTNTVVTLDGSASSDANGDVLTYRWALTSKPSGSSATLSSVTSARPTFNADEAGTYVASLIVNDDQLNSNSASVSITATRANAAPMANAGSPQNVMTNTVVTLDGSASSDANSDALTYRWTLTSKPSGSSATLSSITSARPTFNADAAGTYVASLIVNDGLIDSNTASVSVTATRTNATPMANAGLTQNVVTGAVVTLDGSSSTDANGDPLTFSWSLTSKPAGSSATLSSANNIRPTFTADFAGTYIVSLTVNDGSINSAAVTVTINATVANAAPVANAGAAQSAYLGALVTLDGSASSDANGDALTYAWTPRSYPFFAPTINGANTVRPTFTSRDAGTYVFSLVVNDGQASSTASTVTVNIANGVGPTPAGSGLIVQNIANFWTLDETTLSKRIDASCGEWLYAIDRRPDGVLVGTTGSQLYEINPVTNVCSARGSTPESIRAVAVSASGQTLGISLSQMPRPNGSGYAHRLHKLSSSGASQSFVYLSGASDYVMSIDFGPDGQLYGLGITSGGSGWSIVRIDPETGANTIAFAMPVQPTLGDIDIDSSGVLRTMIDGTLYKFNINTGAQISSTRVPNFPVGISFAPIVYVP
jgi:hypothetical protein